ncbi:MAG: hypothetical protein AB1762_06105 [Gemmatimonadota bacterium]
MFMNLKTIVAALAMLALFLFGAGCGPKTNTVQEYDEKLEAKADFAARWGLKFEASGQIENSHIWIWTWNLTGLHANFRIWGEPKLRTAEDREAKFRLMRDRPEELAAPADPAASPAAPVPSDAGAQALDPLTGPQ